MFTFARLLLRFAFLLYICLFSLSFSFSFSFYLDRDVSLFCQNQQTASARRISLPNFFLDKYTHTAQCWWTFSRVCFFFLLLCFVVPNSDKKFELRKFLHSEIRRKIKWEKQKGKSENKRCATRNYNGKTTTICINVFICARWIDPLLNKRKSYTFFDAFQHSYMRIIRCVEEKGIVHPFVFIVCLFVCSSR